VRGGKTRHMCARKSASACVSVHVFPCVSVRVSMCAASCLSVSVCSMYAFVSVCLCCACMQVRGQERSEVFASLAHNWNLLSSFPSTFYMQAAVPSL
jgi:hypothetical protein